MSKFALFFLLLFFGGLIGALVSSPVFAVVLYQLVYFMNPETRWWGASIPNLPYSFLTVVIMIVMLVVKYGSLGKVTSWRKQPVIKWMLLILVMYYVMMPIALLPTIHSMFTLNFAKLIIIVLVVYKLVDSPKSLDYVLWAYIIGAAYIGYVADGAGRDSTGRVEDIGMIDTGGDSNYTAAALAPAAVILMYFVWLGNKKTKLLSAVCAAFIVNGLVLINSRGAFLGVVAGAGIFLVYMLFSKFQRKGQRPMAIGVVLFGLMGAYALTDKYFWMRMSTLGNLEDGDTSGSNRVEFWLATFDIMRDYPLGVGVSGYEAVSRLYLPERYFEYQEAKAVHSSWFQLLAETGWPGPLFFILLLFSLYRLLRKVKKFVIGQGQEDIYFKILVLESALVSYLVAASFINRIRAESMWWCILFLMIATNIYYLQKIGPTGLAKSDRVGVDSSGKKNNAAS